MEQPRRQIDRRRYEKRGMAVPAEIQGRGPSESTLSVLHRQLVKRYGEGWEVDTIYPGTICGTPTSDMEEGHMVIFKRRRQLRDE